MLQVAMQVRKIPVGCLKDSVVEKGATDYGKGKKAPFRLGLGGWMGGIGW